ncbi:unnamed protein product [Gongylonema pulchrum]|uniref:CUE domain-containing protein n=1 Tax=Gongylonema pulchrum TaxID=637853 RepID=A0A183DPH8_9BILA|nr:unnamed protein product [Gongylonema pulchrum]
MRERLKDIPESAGQTVKKELLDIFERLPEMEEREIAISKLAEQTVTEWDTVEHSLVVNEEEDEKQSARIANGIISQRC